MNRLDTSTSLYLQQHADNPVHWQPWDEEALQEARSSGKPILLSIGYSACHWCHVMAHESFENPAIAGLMNELFINIKIDREERPDLDKVYQLSHQLLTSRGGGWPLTVFLEPSNLTPFFAGTYFPPAASRGMPGFDQVLQRVRQWYDNSHDEILALNQSLDDAINAIQAPTEANEGAPGEVFTAALSQLDQRADRVHGGMQGAPKFPQAPMLAALPAIAQRTGQTGPTEFGLLSLEKMSRGGLRDHLDGGFYRYTVDGDWTIPHFEKMLYDNAQLLPLYAQAAAQESDPWLTEVTEGIAAWMQEWLGLPGGGFAASMDADAEGEEGRFHVWTRTELQENLSVDEMSAAEKVFGLLDPPNFEGKAWHLTRRSGQADEAALTKAVSVMNEVRSGRTPPATDYKFLTAWNALAIDGLARAGSALNRPDWLEQANVCMDFLQQNLWCDGQLFAVRADDQSRFPAYLDDHAFCLQALLSLLRAQWHRPHLDFAIEIADKMLSNFQDEDNGGFYFTDKDQEAPIQRLKVFTDDATPSGNGIASQALMELGHLLARADYIQAAERVLQCASNEMRKYPLGHASLLTALDQHHNPWAQVVINGKERGEMDAWKDLAGQFDRVHCYAIPYGDGPLPGMAADVDTREETVAVVCKGMRCLPPAHSINELKESLEPGD